MNKALTINISCQPEGTAKSISRQEALRWAHQFSREQLIRLIQLLEAMNHTEQEECNE